MADVRSLEGTPVASDFGYSKTGTPIIVDVTAGAVAAYVLDAAGAVQPLSSGGGGGAPTNATYVTMTANATLTNERTLAVGSPITLTDGGANNPVTLDFDETVTLGNNARVAVSRNSGATVGTRRRINFIEGTNVTLTVTDDAGNEEVDVTIAASGGGSASGTTAYVQFTGPAEVRKSVSVIDATVTGTSRIIPTWGAVLDTDDNEPEMDDVTFFARPAAGSFTLFAVAQQPITGRMRINYLVA